MPPHVSRWTNMASFSAPMRPASPCGNATSSRGRSGGRRPCGPACAPASRRAPRVLRQRDEVHRVDEVERHGGDELDVAARVVESVMANGASMYGYMRV